MGQMAAMLAGDGSIGVIGPIEVGDAKLYVDGFVAGAEATNAELEVGVNYTDSFSDTALAAEAATSFIDGGATVLTGTAQMTVGAIGVASERGVLWFGTQSNQTQLAPEVVVANQVYHWEVVLADLIEGIERRHARWRVLRHQPRQRGPGDRVQPGLRGAGRRDDRCRGRPSPPSQRGAGDGCVRCRPGDDGGDRGHRRPAATDLPATGG